MIRPRRRLPRTRPFPCRVILHRSEPSVSTASATPHSRRRGAFTAAAACALAIAAVVSPAGGDPPDLERVRDALMRPAEVAAPATISREGLPIGLQLQGPPFEEERLLRAAHMFQQATEWHKREPEL